MYVLQNGRLLPFQTLHSVLKVALLAAWKPLVVKRSVPGWRRDSIYICAFLPYCCRIIWWSGWTQNRISSWRHVYGGLIFSRVTWVSADPSSHFQNPDQLNKTVSWRSRQSREGKRWDDGNGCGRVCRFGLPPPGTYDFRTSDPSDQWPVPVISIRKLPYKERLQHLNLYSLKYRRLRGDIIEVFKILHHIYDSSVAPELIRNTSATRGNKYKLLNHTFHYNFR